MTVTGPHVPIDFGGLAAALLQMADAVVPRWLPNGTERNGRWYVGDFDGGAGESANVSLSTGTWIDNAGGGDDRGGDLLSLHKRVFGFHTMREAALAVMDEMGWLPTAAPPPPPREAAAAAAASAAYEAEDAPPWPADDVPPAPANDGAGRRAADEPATQKKRADRWRSVLPVPPHAPLPKAFTFGFKNKVTGAWEEQTASRTWAYEFEGQRFGWVARFDRIDSKGQAQKDVLQLTWCEDTHDPRGSSRWHWKHWPQPRPLYVPTTLLSGTPADVPVVVVEGEKCAEAGMKLLGHEFDFVSWPGGGKAWSMAAWSWLMGRTVYLWPDCDAQRLRLNRAEKEAGADPDAKPLLPAHKQPGMATMVGIGELLQAEHACTVLMLPIPAPGTKPPGWDIADAADEGWDAAQVREFIRAAVPFVAPNDAARAAAEPISTPSSAGAGEESDARGWRVKLLTTSSGATSQVRENVVLALDGLPDLKLMGIPDVQGVVGFNELTNDVVKLKPSPWGTPVGAWAEVDDLLMGEWLVRQHWLPSFPRGTLEEAVRMVAYRHRFHPVRAYLNKLRWDGIPRLSTWLRRACLAEDEWDDSEPLQRYLARVGTFFMMAMCSRALRPGCKFDYMMILEGKQGMRKSTLLRTLAGDFFADTGLVLGDKDSYQQLQGVWLYEIPELDAFSKADVMKIKAFVASSEDYFRASFDRRAAKYPRQLVFGGTTNEEHYLTDPTGNRRFWPVRVTRIIDIDWVAEHRDQLFAEAMQRIADGKRFHPMREEELELFVPQQETRAVENAIESVIARYLYPPDLPGVAADGLLVHETSVVALLGKVGIGLEKLGPGRFHEKQAAAALRRLGWHEARSSAPGRPRVYRRPDQLPGGSEASATRTPQRAKQEAVADDCPF